MKRYGISLNTYVEVEVEDGEILKAQTIAIDSVRGNKKGFYNYEIDYQASSNVEITEIEEVE